MAAVKGPLHMVRGGGEQEKRMAKFLEGQIKALTNAVAMEEVPREQRARGGSRTRKRRLALGQ